MHKGREQEINVSLLKLGAPRQLVLFSLLILVIVGWFVTPEMLQVTPQPEMPPFRPQLEAMKDYYKFHFLPDGYPARRENGNVFEHPMYGAYVLHDYTLQYHHRPTNELREAIRMVANASIKRMDDYRGTLVFWYPADHSVMRAYKRYYSGLTQSYYMLHLLEAYQITNEEPFKEASEKTFRSLLIQDEDGGVCYSWEEGMGIAEVPMQPNGLILNGWLTILVNLHRYAQLTDSVQAHKLFTKSSQTVAKLLPLYDAQEYRNSRYSLTGFQYLKLQFSAVADVVIRDLKLEIPKQGRFSIPVQNQSSRWEYYVFEKDAKNLFEGISVKGRTLRMNLVLSRLSFPQENVLHVTLNSTRQLQMDVYLHVGVYDPLSTSQTENKWRHVTSLQIKQGLNQIAIALPWELTDLIAYPTNFKKKIGGRFHNVYHFVHIGQLKRLYLITGIKVFHTYADRWERYVSDWPSMEIYAGLAHSRHHRQR